MSLLGLQETTSRIAGRLVVSGLSTAAPEWKRGFFSLNFGLQFLQFLSNHFDRLFFGHDSVFPLFCAREAVSWLHWLHGSISLWHSLSPHLSHRMNEKFLAFFQLRYCFIVVFTVVCIITCDKVFDATVFFARKFLSVFSLFFLPF